MNCKNCDIEKDIIEFYKGYKTCKECIKLRQRKRYRKNKEKILTGNKTCKKCNIEKEINNFRINRRDCIDCEKEYGRKYNKEKKYIRDNWNNNNKEKMKQLQSEWYQKNKKYINEKNKNRYKNV